MFVCLSVSVPYGRPNGWADRDQTWHTHSCPPRECFCQGQCQGHSCMRASDRITKHLERCAKATPGERLRNSVRTTGNYSLSNEARRCRRRAASAWRESSRTPSGGRVITASSIYSRTEMHAKVLFIWRLKVVVQSIVLWDLGRVPNRVQEHRTLSSKLGPDNWYSKFSGVAGK